MSSLRRRTSNSGIQWLIIGLILGLGCASVVCVAGIVLQVITISAPGAIALLPTPTVGPTTTPVVVIVTATQAPITSTASISTAAATSQVIVAVTPSVAATMVPFVVTPVSSSATDQVVATESSVASVGATLAPTSSIITLPTTGAGANLSATLSASGAATTDTTGSIAVNLTPTELVAINAGIFKMGTTAAEASSAVQQCTVTDKGQCQLTDAEDSIPPHDTTLNAFQIERYSVSFTQYLAFLNNLPTSYKNGCDGQLCVATNLEDKNSPIKLDGVSFNLSNSLFARDPVTFVTWYGADAYCKAIGRRLPTEAEWERTGKATTGGGSDPNRIYPWGNNWDPANANTDRPVSLGFSKAVDSYPTGASADGIFNLSGNAGQWVSDWYDPAYYKSSDINRFLNPKGPSNGQMKVWRGGGWDEVPFFARVVQRQALEPGKTRADLGFRCAADSQTSAAALPAGASNNPPTAILPTGTANTTLKP